VLATALALSTTLALFACSSDDGTTAESTDRALQLWTRQAEDGLAVYEALAEQYEAETGQEVQVTSVVSDFEQRLTRAAAGGDLPDLVVNDTAGLGQLVANGLVQPIDREEVTGHGDISERAWEAARGADGQFYGVPFSAHAFILLMRSDWAENLGLSSPTTWDELRDAAVAFTNDDPNGSGDDDTFGLNVPGSTERGYASWYWTTYLWQGGGDYFDAHDNGTFTSTINSPEAVAALAFQQELACADGVVQPDAVNTVTVDAHSNFAGGLTGFYQTGPWMYSRYDNEMDEGTFEAVRPPAGPGGDTVMAEGENTYLMTGTDMRQEALDFAAWLASPDGQLGGMNPGGYAVTRLPVNTTLDAGEIYQDDRWALVADVYATSGRYVPAVPNWTPFRQMSGEAVNEALADCSADPQQLLDELNDKFTSELESQGVLAEG
jgi:multiple sugar transport system substrate-binding protein